MLGYKDNLKSNTDLVVVIHKTKGEMKIFFIIAAIVYTVHGNSETTCEDSSFLCRIPSYVTEYSCKYFTETKSNCPKSCGICTGYCNRVESYSRQRCGTSGTTASQCHSRGCCWNPTYDGSGTPWCFSVKSGGKEDEE